MGDATTMVADWWNRQPAVGRGLPYLVLADGRAVAGYATAREADEVASMYARPHGGTASKETKRVTWSVVKR